MDFKPLFYWYIFDNPRVISEWSQSDPRVVPEWSQGWVKIWKSGLLGIQYTVAHHHIKRSCQSYQLRSWAKKWWTKTFSQCKVSFLLWHPCVESTTIGVNSNTYLHNAIIKFRIREGMWGIFWIMGAEEILNIVEDTCPLMRRSYPCWLCDYVKGVPLRQASALHNMQLHLSPTMCNSWDFQKKNKVFFLVDFICWSVMRL